MQGSIDFTGLLSGDIIGEGGTSVIANPSGSATDTLNKVQIDETIYSVEGGGGTEVIANPTGTATDELQTVEIDDVIYSISGEQQQADWTQTDTSAVDYIKHKPTIPPAQVNSDWNSSSGVSEILNKPTIPVVIANPSGEPTTPLSKININNIIYGISGASFSSIRLYNSSQFENVITLSDIYTNYEYLMIQAIATAGSGFLKSTLISISDLSVGNNVGVSDDSAFLWYTITATDELTYSGSSGSYYIKSIYGLNASSEGYTQQQADWTQSDNRAVDYIKHKPTLSTVATSGSYDDLTDKPTIPDSADDISFNNTGTGMVATDVQDAITELKSNLTDNPTDDNSLQISLDRIGQQRTITFFRIGWAQVKSFINGLPATDNPRSDRIYSNAIYKSFNSSGVQKYVSLGFIIIRMNSGTRETTAVTATAYNSSNATETVIADGDQITGELTWFTD